MRNIINNAQHIRVVPTQSSLPTGRYRIVEISCPTLRRHLKRRLLLGIQMCRSRQLVALQESRLDPNGSLLGAKAMDDYVKR